MRDEVGLIQGQARAEKAQAFKTAELLQGLFTDALDCKRECGLITEQAEKDHVVLVYKLLNLRSLESHGVRRITTDQAKIAPDRDETGLLAYNGFIEPIRVLASVTAAIDEGTCKDVVILQNSRPVPSPMRGRNVAAPRRCRIRKFLYYCFASRSRISVSSTSSAEGFGGSAGFSSSFFFMELSPLITMKIANAIIKKSRTVLMNTP